MICSHHPYACITRTNHPPSPPFFLLSLDVCERAGYGVCLEGGCLHHPPPPPPNCARGHGQRHTRDLDPDWWLGPPGQGRSPLDAARDSDPGRPLSRMLRGHTAHCTSPMSHCIGDPTNARKCAAKLAIVHTILDLICKVRESIQSLAIMNRSASRYASIRCGFSPIALGLLNVHFT